MSKIPLQVSPSSMSFQNGHGVIIELLLLCRREDMFHTCEKAQVCQHAKKKRKVIQEAAVFLDKKHCNVCIPDIKGSFLYLRVYDLRGKEEKKSIHFQLES